MEKLEDKIEEVINKLGYDAISKVEARHEILNAVIALTPEEFARLSKWCTCNVNHAKGDKWCPICGKPLSK